MSCRFSYESGAYVLGALAVADRQEFERHLPGCADCTRTVGELAGLPGLLGRIDARIAEELQVDDPVPTTLLPALHRAVQRARLRRTRAMVALAGAAAVAVAALLVTLSVSQLGAGTTAAGPPPATSPSPTVPSGSGSGARPMQPVGDVPVRAAVWLEHVTWGTRLTLVCTYDTRSVDYELPPEVDYTLFVRTRDGRAERVGSWRSVDGQAMRLTAATASPSEELESVEVRTVDGRVVLRVAT